MTGFSRPRAGNSFLSRLVTRSSRPKISHRPADRSVYIDLSVTLGSLKIVVPPGTQIENECHEVFSSSTHPRRGRNRVAPNGLLVILSGRVFMGEVKIQERPPTGEEKPLFRPLIGRLLGRPDE